MWGGWRWRWQPPPPKLCEGARSRQLVRAPADRASKQRMPTLPRTGRSVLGLRSSDRKRRRAADARPPEKASATESPGRMSECKRTALRTLDSSCSYRQGWHSGSRPRATSSACALRHFMQAVPGGGATAAAIAGWAASLPLQPCSPHPWSLQLVMVRIEPVSMVCGGLAAQDSAQAKCRQHAGLSGLIGCDRNSTGTNRHVCLHLDLRQGKQVYCLTSGTHSELPPSAPSVFTPISMKW
jgi:hypothetical protein